MTTLADKIVQYAAQFRRDGFVMVPNLLGADELDRYGAAVDEAVARRKRFDNRKLGEKTPYEQSFIQCINLWEDTPAVRPLTFHPIVCETAARLLGVEKIRLWHDQALYKEAGGRLTDPHQDQPYWPMVETDTITAWIPFDGSTHATGCMGYIPGSHAVGLQAFVNIFKPEDAIEILKMPQIKDTPPVYVEVPRGGVAFHHGLTVHMAKANSGSQTRRVHTMIFFRDGSTRKNHFPHDSVERYHVEIGAKIDSPVTPIAWPRAPGDLPEPPDAPISELFAKAVQLGAFPDKGGRADR